MATCQTCKGRAFLMGSISDPKPDLKQSSAVTGQGGGGGGGGGGGACLDTRELICQAGGELHECSEGVFPGSSHLCPLENRFQQADEVIAGSRPRSVIPTSHIGGSC